MKALTIELKSLRIPFKVAFKHASASRNVTQGVLVIARANGLAGYGEGCPRDYVTGETDVSVAEFFDEHKNDIEANIADLHSLRAWCKHYESDIDKNPAAWCAIELALLDLFAKKTNQSVEALLGLPALTEPFEYSAVLGAMGAKQFAETLGRYRKLGLRHYKIKLSGEIERDRESVDILRTSGITPAQVRADANNLWSDHRAALDYLKSLNFDFTAVEEPLRPGQFAEMAWLAESLGAHIILDESIAREDQLAQLSGPSERWIVNLRVSKMGGVLRSLSLAQRCREGGFDVIVGAQVGETSLLTRAALTVVQAARDVVIAQEGAFGTLLLESDIVQPTLMFGPAGKLVPSSFGLDQSPGSGLTPIPDIERWFNPNDNSRAH